jgi:hypothetical protein
MTSEFVIGLNFQDVIDESSGKAGRHEARKPSIFPDEIQMLLIVEACHYLNYLDR